MSSDCGSEGRGFEPRRSPCESRKDMQNTRKDKEIRGLHRSLLTPLRLCHGGLGRRLNRQDRCDTTVEIRPFGVGKANANAGGGEGAAMLHWAYCGSFEHGNKGASLTRTMKACSKEKEELEGWARGTLRAPQEVQKLHVPPETSVEYLRSAMPLVASRLEKFRPFRTFRGSPASPL
jgi:hypothetical protein